MARVANSFDYDAAPARVWAMVTDLTALATVCRPWLTFHGLPEGRIATGQSLDVGVRLFGLMPAQPYHMTVELCDDAAMTFQSREAGSGVQRWDHRLCLSPSGTGTRLEETIEIEAGRLTPVFVNCARFLYRRRHTPRMTLLETGAF